MQTGEHGNLLKFKKLDLIFHAQLIYAQFKIGQQFTTKIPTPFTVWRGGGNRQNKNGLFQARVVRLKIPSLLVFIATKFHN